MRVKTGRARTGRAKTERAFTLVEILTVIVIISILASLVTLAVAGALRSAKRARAATEMSQIAMALEHYKAEFGEYPPDFFDNAALVRHVKKRWPRFELDTSRFAAIKDDDYHADSIRQAISNVYNNRTFYPPALRREWLGTDQGTTYISFRDVNPQAKLAALCFWLGGFPDKEGKYLGFGADPEAPFGRNNSGNGDVNNGKNYPAAPQNSTDVVITTYDKKNMMELTVNKNVYFGGGKSGESVVVPCIVARVSSEEVVPLVYFRGKTDGGPAAYLASDLKFFDFAEMGVSAGLPAVSGWPQLGFSVPYAKGGNPFANPAVDVAWCEPTKYQIIHPGLDLHFGNAGTTSPAMSPFTRNNFRSLKADAAGNNLGQKDLDNLTNFSEGKELKSILP